jgi:hypothetical protein
MIIDTQTENGPDHKKIQKAQETPSVFFILYDLCPAFPVPYLPSRTIWLAAYENDYGSSLNRSPD